ncbi:MAG: hypothetical protein ACI808_002674 [Paraglaciecola sp.]|jgi:hypothetical protein
MTRISLILAMLIVSFCSQATIVLKSELSLLASGRYDIALPGPNDFEDSSTVAQSGTLDPLATSVFIDESQGDASILMDSSVAATWNDANSGLVSFSNIGWQTANFLNGSVGSFGRGWTYSFVAEADGVFDIETDILVNPATTDDFGLNFSLTWLVNGTFFDSDRITIGDLPTLPDLSMNLFRGNSYELWIGSGSNVAGGIGTRTSLVDAAFKWNITEDSIRVSEPGSLALMSIFLIGLCLRRKKMAT